MAAKPLALLLSLLLAGILIASLGVGSTDVIGLAEGIQAALAMFGLGEPLEKYQALAELRVIRICATVGVGAALALSGALLQGVFRNDLASPSIIGVSSGAGLGASLAILVIGGYGPRFMIESAVGVGPIVVTFAALIGAGACAWLVTTLATAGGRISVPMLLLVGIAVNAIAAGLLAAIQSYALRDYDVSQALFSWVFGRLEDRSPFQVSLLWVGLLLSASVIPFVALELDLFSTGEEDAQGLGVNTVRVKFLAILAASASAAIAVSVAGQISFIGLVVPHVLRRITTASHRAILPLCLLAGPVFLAGTELVQRSLLGDAHLQPGVTMSLLGGPFFLFLLVRHRKELRAW